MHGFSFISKLPQSVTQTHKCLAKINSMFGHKDSLVSHLPSYKKFLGKIVGFSIKC